jgi:hypothetical protein
MALAWTCELMRLSVFSNQPLKLHPNAWQVISGRDEEAPNVQRGAARQIIFGPHLDGQLSLATIGPRADLILSPAPNQEKLLEGALPTIGAWPAVLEGFEKSVLAYLREHEHPTVRMAFASSLLCQFNAPVDASKALIERVKSFKPPADTFADPLYRINWPRPSRSVNDLKLNRLTTWSVQRVQLQLMIEGTPGTNSDPMVITHFLKLELDHNTDGDRTEPFDRAQLMPIYKELTDLALQNAEQGEVP